MNKAYIYALTACLTMLRASLHMLQGIISNVWKKANITPGYEKDSLLLIIQTYI